jgi:carbamoylphosphate synthase large subunit
MRLPELDAGQTVWVGAAGTGTAFGLIRSVRKRWGDKVRIVAADTNPAHLVAATTLADAFVKVPPIADPAFIKVLAAEFARSGPVTYVAILDAEILLAAELAAEGRLPRAVALIAPPVASARICLDKLAAARWLQASGLPSPSTALPGEVDWRGEPLFAKPRRGLGSVGVRLLSTASELRSLGASEDMVVQALCSGPEVTLDVFRSRDGSLNRAICRERLEVKAGVCTKARVFEDATLSALATRVAAGLGLVGTFCMQVMRHREEWSITDINPRPGAGTSMTVAAGIDVHCAMLADSWGLDARELLPPLSRELFVVRQYVELLT